MSKTIKVIDLLNKIANGKEIPEKIRYKGIIYSTNSIHNEYRDKLGNTFFDISFIIPSFLNDNVDIVIFEDEEEPEIDIQGIREITSFGIKQNQDGINLLIRAVKQLDNQINNK